MYYNCKILITKESVEKMKKTFIGLVILLLIVLSVVLIFKESPSLSEKRAYIMEQEEIHEKDLSHLMILKKSPIKDSEESYEMLKPTLNTLLEKDRHLLNTLLFKDSYFSKEPKTQALDVAAVIFLDEAMDLNDGKEIENNTKKITFQNSEGLYTSGKQITQDEDITYMYHELTFLKENIFYKIKYAYLFDENKKDTFDFIKFLDKNLVPVSK